MEETVTVYYFWYYDVYIDEEKFTFPTKFTGLIYIKE